MMHWTNANSARVERAWTSLEVGDLLMLRGARGCTVEATAPRNALGGPPPLLWLTEQGELEDVFLRPGERHVLRRDGLVVVGAWGPIGVRVVPKTSAAERAPSLLVPSVA